MTRKFWIFATAIAFFAASCSSGGENTAEEATAETTEEAAEEGAAPAVVNGNFAINTEKSTVNWLGKKVTGQHNGTINVKGGDLTVAEGAITGGTVTIDMGSIQVLDIPADQKENADLMGHLMSDDFFGVETHPEATFTIKSSSAMEVPDNMGNNMMITGDLTIKGITKEISFPAKVDMMEKGVKAKATVMVDRTLYDVKYGSGKFFENLGDKMIDDVFQLQLEIMAPAAGA